MKSLLKKHFLAPFLIVLAVIVVLIAGILGFRALTSSNSKATKLGFENIGELATQVAYCTEVNVTEASQNLWGIEIPFTQSKIIYSYDVEVKAGLDFKDITWSVDETNSIIRVNLPEIRILDSSIIPDSFQLYHEDESIFRPITLEENNEALKQLELNAENTAVSNGLLENARLNAETILTGFFANEYDPKIYTIEFHD
jgi:hypothetical protein